MVLQTMKRIISSFMLMLFGFLLVAGALSSGHGSVGDCNEFGHYHFPQMAISDKERSKSLHSKTHQDSTDGDCHQGKIMFAVKLPSTPEISGRVNLFRIAFEWLYSTQNNFESPDLEPRRKPPKPAMV